ncbi:GAF domain-containing protein [Variovorax sp. J2P1-59]|uniref:GAF domain-containing protein n=1 Tax=Variovorax flavidus TaxID=3053501 RepID=UPI002577FE22|nr:GAF domain-containing protein [Variovorax sp. J2P1-59]MDM0073804.1 GAF domain-containing protein [Variovorax sp. J2P1-59]
MGLPRTLQTLSSILDADGPSNALAFLNDGVAHRYSAIYRLAGLTLKNVLLHDKTGKLRPEYLAAIPFDSSYCQFVVRDGQFRTDNSSVDARLRGYSYPSIALSYHSVPILNPGGDIWGTLSHFDTAPLPLPDEEFELLKGAAPLLATHLVEP